MKCLILFFIAVTVGTATSDGGKFTSIFDEENLENILNNQRIYKKYFLCLKNEGTCTPDARELKASLPDTLQNGCEKCPEKQKAGSEKVLRYILENKPNDYLELEKIFDPDRKYRAKYKEDAEKRGLKFPDK